MQGCSSCGGRFFFYIRDDQLREIEESKKRLVELESSEKRKIEDDVRKILKIEDETKPVILDFESIRVIQPGKFEIDIVSLINKRPIIFKIEEGKYIIDLESI